MSKTIALEIDVTGEQAADAMSVLLDALGPVAKKVHDAGFVVRLLVDGAPIEPQAAAEPGAAPGTEIEQLRARAAANGWRETYQNKGKFNFDDKATTTVSVVQSETGRVTKVMRTSGAWGEPTDFQEPTTDKFATAMRWLEGKP